MTDDDKLQVNPGYAWAQLARALSGIGETAGKRVRQWTDVLAGIADGSLKVGSRQPSDKHPIWNTLEVAHGGFATGRPMAGGALLPHEQDLAARLNVPADGDARGKLNLYYLTNEGRADLAQLIESGRYRVGCPEEGALLAVYWLSENGHAEKGERVLQEISPFFGQLRFYPSPSDVALPLDAGVHVQTVGEVVGRLKERKPSREVLRMREAILVWVPAYDSLVKLFLELIDGDLPRYQEDASGSLTSGPSGAPVVVGGQLMDDVSDDWLRRAAVHLQEYTRLRNDHRLCTKPDKPKENFFRLRGYAHKLVEGHGKLGSSERADVRKILASYLTKYGTPDGTGIQSLRLTQKSNAEAPTYDKVGKILAERLSALPAELGDPLVDQRLLPLTPEERQRLGVTSEEYRWPEILKSVVLRCYHGPLEDLIERGLVGSGESLAELIPTLAANAKCSAIPDAHLRRLYTGLYEAFRKRRSLLLLHLQSQVKFHELPWVHALEGTQAGASESHLAKQVLTDVALLALKAFPQTITPNKLVKELRALAHSAGEEIPLVDELAADIFMGSFSVNFLKVAQSAARLLRGSLYEAYYEIDYAKLQSFHESGDKKWGTPVSAEFANLCESRAQLERGGRSSVAQNGKIIEQAQVVTTHNLASLFESLPLTEQLGPDGLTELAKDSFKWVCKRQQLPLKEWRTRLTNMKNCAYAWRQMVFFVSMLDAAKQQQFFEWAGHHLRAQGQELGARLSPALLRLRAVSRGEVPEGPVFYGWATGKHWLLSAKI